MSFEAEALAALLLELAAELKAAQHCIAVLLEGVPSLDNQIVVM